jgi:hypothetical protein
MCEIVLDKPSLLGYLVENYEDGRKSGSGKAGPAHKSFILKDLISKPI